MYNKKVLDISGAGVLKMLLGLVIVYFLFLMKDILILVVFALVISILFNPMIDFLQRLRLPRVLAATLIYVLVFSIFGVSIFFVFKSFIPEIQQFMAKFTEYFDKIAPPLQNLGWEAFASLETFMSTAERWLADASVNIFTAVVAVFGGILSTFMVFSIAFFFSLEGKWIEQLILLVFPKRYENIALGVWQKSRKKITSWFGVRLFSSLFVGILSFFVLKLFKVDYAFSLGLFAGITDIIPVLGPVVAGVLITFLVFLEDWVKAVLILVVFILIQRVEENILIPLLSKKFIGLPPVLVIISLVIGAKFWGFLGVVLVIPLAGIIFEFVKDFLEKRKEALNSEFYA